MLDQDADEPLEAAVDGGWITTAGAPCCLRPRSRARTARERVIDLDVPSCHSRPMLSFTAEVELGSVERAVAGGSRPSLRRSAPPRRAGPPRRDPRSVGADALLEAGCRTWPGSPSQRLVDLLISSVSPPHLGGDLILRLHQDDVRVSCGTAHARPARRRRWPRSGGHILRVVRMAARVVCASSSG